MRRPLKGHQAGTLLHKPTRRPSTSPIVTVKGECPEPKCTPRIDSPHHPAVQMDPADTVSPRVKQIVRWLLYCNIVAFDRDAVDPTIIPVLRTYIIQSIVIFPISFFPGFLRFAWSHPSFEFPAHHARPLLLLTKTRTKIFSFKFEARHSPPPRGGHTVRRHDIAAL